MSIGQNTLDWLRTDLFQVEAAWSEETARGFRWWPHRQAQTLEVIGQEAGPDGAPAALVQVRTELLRDLDLDEEVLAVLQAVTLRTAGMAGPVYDPARRTLDLCTLVRVNADNDGWMRRLIGLAAMLQIRDADRGASAIAEAVGAVPAQSGHPARVLRTELDGLIAEALELLDTDGRATSRWPGADLAQFVDDYLDQPPCPFGNRGRDGLHGGVSPRQAHIFTLRVRHGSDPPVAWPRPGVAPTVPRVGDIECGGAAPGARAECPRIDRDPDGLRVRIKRFDPDADSGMDLDNEYAEALSMFAPPRTG